MDLDATPHVQRKPLPVASGHAPGEAVRRRRLADRPDVQLGRVHHFAVKEVGKVSDLLGRMRSRSAAVESPVVQDRGMRAPGLDTSSVEEPLQMVTPLEEAKSWKCLGYRVPDCDVAFDGPPHPGQVRQGYIGDCWAIAVLAQAAAFEPHELESRITKIAPNLYDVRLGGPDSQPERVHRIDTSVPEIQVRFSRLGRRLTMGTHASLDSEVLWPVLFEKALAAEQPDGYEDIGHGGSPGWAICRLLGRPYRSGTLLTSDQFSNSDMDAFFRHQLAEHLPTVLSIHVPDSSTPIQAPEGLSKVKAFLYRRELRKEQRKELLHLQNMAQEVGLIAREDSRHAYWLYDYDPINRMVKLANPHGIEFTSDWMSIDQLRKLAYFIDYGEKRQDGT